MERLNCSGVADGCHGLDPASGAWGDDAGPQQGWLGDRCRNRDGTEGLFAALRRWPRLRCRSATEHLDDGA